MSEVSLGAGSLAEWGPAPPHARTALAPYAALSAVILLVGALVAFLSVTAGLVLILVAAAAVFLFGRGRGAAALTEAGARPARIGELPRVRNLVAGLATDLATTPPALWVIEQGAGSPGGTRETLPNALVAWRGGPVIAVSERLEDMLTRTECEAVLTHCLVRLGSGEAKATTLRVGLGPFAPTGREAAAADLPAVARTRYPPALAHALEKVGPRKGSFAALWFAPEAGGEASPARRAEAVRSL